MASEERINRINELIKRELGQLILEEIEFPLGVFATITNVKTCSKMSDAKISISVFPEAQSQRALEILTKQAGYLQRLLNRKLVMRFVPRIAFAIDKDLNKAQKIEALLEKVRIEDEE